jgi:signal transduction histidine kinase
MQLSFFPQFIVPYIIPLGSAAAFHKFDFSSYFNHITSSISLATFSSVQFISPALLSIIFGLLLMVFVVIFYLQQKRLKASKLKLKQVASNNDVLIHQVEQLKETVQSCDAEYNQLFQYNHLIQEELEKVKRDLKDAKRIAEEADMLKSNFLANMSHEIRTPMNGILGFAQLLQDDSLEKEMQQRYLDIVCHNGTMLVNLIDDIMDISKIEAGQLSLNKTFVNLDDLIFDLYTFFNEIKFKQEKEHITLRLLNLNDDETSTFFTDGQRVRQVLSNLIGNSIKFTDKGTVEFGYINKKDENLIQFFVRDTGIGIPSDKKDMIFDRFRQIEEGSTRKYGGTGIGLFISKHIVELLGGRIWVDSEPGVGSKFYFNLPYQKVINKENSTTVYTPPTHEYHWEGKVIVIAEDVETNYKFLKTILQKTNAKVVWARDGEEAVTYCRENPNVDMVLMDIQMPKLNGYEATATIKKINPKITIIAQTAYAMPNDNIKCIEAGCNDYISKPINSHILLEKINSFLLPSFKAI